MDLDERKCQVLQAIVEDYVATAAPVGSRTLARKYGLGVSPATIRNEMADLEEMGFLEQPHTSAGRVPSDKGYRFYVDSLMKVRLAKEDFQRIYGVYKRKIMEVETLLMETVKALSDTTNYLALILGPCKGRTCVKRVFFLDMRPGLAMLIVVTDAGFIESRFVEVPKGITSQELAQVGAILQSRLEGMDLDRIRSTTLREIELDLGRYRMILEQVFEVVHSALGPSEDDRVWVGSTSKMLSLPEFRDFDKMQTLMNLMERQDLIRMLLSEVALEEGVSVSIGYENPIHEIRDCSLVTTTYQVGDHIIGTIGLLGPKRMDYPRAVAVVELVEESLSEAFRRVSGA